MVRWRGQSQSNDVRNFALRAIAGAEVERPKAPPATAKAGSLADARYALDNLAAVAGDDVAHLERIQGELFQLLPSARTSSSELTK